MRRFCLSILLALFCALGLLGCGLGARSRARTESAPTNPLRHRSDAGKPGMNLAEESSGSPESPKRGTQEDQEEVEVKKLAKFDPELLELIETELENTPPDEREQFYNDIVSLQPAMVRQIIQTRRIVRQVGQEAPNQFAGADSLAEGNPQAIRHVAGEESTEQDSPQTPIGRQPSRDPGLGAVDPWNRKTQSDSSAGGNWSNESTKPPAPLPFNQIPALPGTGHSSGYGSRGRQSSQNERGRRNSQEFEQRNPGSRPKIQPPPGGASTPVHSQEVTGSVRPNTPRQHQNARVPYDYNPLAPPVPEYNRDGDPFAGDSPPVRTASQDPDQKLPGARDSLGLNDSFGPQSESQNSQSPEESSSAGGDSRQSKTDLNRLIAAKEREISKLRFSEQTEPAEKTAYIQKHVYLRMLYLMAGEEARAVAAIPEIPAPDQEFWQQMFWAMSNYFDTKSMPESDYRATQTIAQLRTAIQKLQENARLELRNVAFCHKISSFGNFDRFPQDEFGPGQPVLVYAEVSNFKSEPTTLPNKPNQMAYRTQLKSTIAIHRLGPSGELVERFEFEPTEDLCHNHRRDYFHSYEFTIPQRISLGPHVMTLTVEDQLSRKVATYRLNFMVK